MRKNGAPRESKGSNDSPKGRSTRRTAPATGPRATKTGSRSSETGSKTSRPRIAKSGNDFEDRPKRNYEKAGGSGKSFKEYRKSGDKSKSDFNSDFGDKKFKKPFDKGPRSYEKSDDRPARKFSRDGDEKRSFGDDKKFKKPFDKGPRSYEKSADRPARKFSKDGDEKRSFGDDKKFKKPFDKGPRSYEKSADRPARKFSRDGDEKRSFGDDKKFKKPFDKGPRSYEKSADRPARKFSRDGDEKRSFGDDKKFKKPFDKGPRSYEKSADRPARKFSRDGDEKRSFGDDKKFKKPFDKGPRSYKGKTEDEDQYIANKYGNAYNYPESKRGRGKKAPEEATREDDGTIRLNKFIANAGICSRREADEFIKTGTVTVNGKIVTEMGYRVTMDDKVIFGGRPVRGERAVYILLNKPKDYITTTKDPQNRKTVMELVAGAGSERLFPVGRLDRNTTGLLLLTNDGEIADKLMHPRKKVIKVYQVELDKKLTPNDLTRLREGIELEDGFFKPDEVDYVEGDNKKMIGIEIHSGKNRIVRRLFETLNYKVIKLDRVFYAGLTKRGIPRAKWRFLTEQEINMLKMI